MKYVIKNPTGRRISVMGRFPVEIEPFAEGVEVSLSDTVAARIKAAYPALVMAAQEQPAAVEEPKDSVEVFNSDAKVKGVGTDRCVVTYKNFKFKVEASTTEEALQAAYAEYAK